jgi:hypothetical protein
MENSLLFALGCFLCQAALACIGLSFALAVLRYNGLI